MPSRSAARPRGRRRGPRVVRDPSDPEAAREAALQLLERVRRTRFQLEAKLRERGFREDVIATLLDRLTAVGLVDDLGYAQAFLRERMTRRGAAWRRLELELRRRGVSTEIVVQARESTWEELGGKESEAAAARRILTQVGGRYRKLDPRARKRRLAALLARRGFEWATIAEVLGGTLDQPE